MASTLSDASRKQGVHDAMVSSLKRTYAMFDENVSRETFPVDPVANKIRITGKVLDSYSQVALPDKALARTAAGRQHVDEQAASILGGDKKQLPLLLTDTEVIRSSGKASTSLLQRRLKL